MAWWSPKSRATRESAEAEDSSELETEDVLPVTRELLDLQQAAGNKATQRLVDSFSNTSTDTQSNSPNNPTENVPSNVRQQMENQSGERFSSSTNVPIRNCAVNRGQQTNGDRRPAMTLPQTLSPNVNRQSSNSNAAHIDGTVIPNGTGEPLDARSLSLMESRFRQDLSEIRIHHDSQASNAAD